MHQEPKSPEPRPGSSFDDIQRALQNHLTALLEAGHISRALHNRKYYYGVPK